MGEKPAFKKVGASTYACTVCGNFKVEITKKLNAGQLQAHLEKRLAQHIKQYHTEDVNQAAARIDREATGE
jgi:hypothetical protein